MAKQVENEYYPDSVSPPGETLLETIELKGITQDELAVRTGRSITTIDGNVRGTAELTDDMAADFERVLGIPARFWRNRERHYREFLARRDDVNRSVVGPAAR